MYNCVTSSDCCCIVDTGYIITCDVTMTSLMYDYGALTIGVHINSKPDRVNQQSCRESGVVFEPEQVILSDLCSKQNIKRKQLTCFSKTSDNVMVGKFDLENRTIRTHLSH